MTEAGGDRGRRRVALVAVGAGIVLALVVGTLLVISRDDSSSPSTQQVLLEPVGSSGEDPFTQSVAVQEVALQTSVSPTETTDTDIAVAGNQPGLYGGTQDSTSCDANALVDFLETNPEKGKAWADPLGIAQDEIRSYVAGLTPVLLRTDTRVTNHGFRDGQATPLQSVLQAGTAVMVDRFGVPRVRCSCGNPLTEPAPLPSSLGAATTDGDVRLVGQPWAQWDPTIVLVVQATVEVDQLVIFDIDTELTYVQPVGSDVDEPRETDSKPENPTEDTVVLTGDGVEIRRTNGDTELIEFGERFSDVHARLVAVLGSSAAPRMGAGSPIVCSAVWGDVEIEGFRNVFKSWILGGPETVDGGPTFETDKGIGIGDTRADVLAAYGEGGPLGDRNGRSPESNIVFEYETGGDRLRTAFGVGTDVNAAADFGTCAG